MKDEMEESQIKKGPPELRERTKDFALRIIRLYGALPKTTEAQVIGKQVLRSGTSIEHIIGRHFAPGPMLSLSVR